MDKSTPFTHPRDGQYFRPDDPRNPNWRGVKCPVCREHHPLLGQDKCSACVIEENKILRAIVESDRSVSADELIKRYRK